MRWSKCLIPTLKESPAEAEMLSHALLLRGGFIQKLSSGVYNFLPLGFRVLRKVENIIRKHMDRAGALEILMPALTPKDLWVKSGRYDSKAMQEILFRVKDRTGREFVYAPTHEEIVTDMVSRTVQSYKELPLNLYQIQGKFRDEPRPRFGLVRGKEFIMKDAYSFDVDSDSAFESYKLMCKAYRDIFEACGLKTTVAEADSGAMGGSHSQEFLVLSPAGEDFVAIDAGTGFAANLEKANAPLPAEKLHPVPEGDSSPVEKFATPDIRTIEDLTKDPYKVSADRQIKTLVFLQGEEFIIVLIRGDRELSEPKLIATLQDPNVVMAGDDSIREKLGAYPGSLGAVGITGVKIICDDSLQEGVPYVTGANEDDFHFKNVVIGRDINPTDMVNVRIVEDGDLAPESGNTLNIERAIETGHVFLLGDKYSKALGAAVLNREGKRVPCVMGCYGIGVSRLLSTIVEQHNDENGIIWPTSVAPYRVNICLLDPANPDAVKLAEMLYDFLWENDLETILDDRDERPGIKFKDHDLIGIPYRITIGARGLKEGIVELASRKSSAKQKIAVGDKLCNEVVSVVKA